MINCVYSYYEPILSFRLLDFTDSVFLHSLTYFSLTGGYAFMAIFLVYFTKCMKPINLVVLGLFLSGVFNFMVGPNKLLPNSLITIIIGLFFTGMCLVI